MKNNRRNFIKSSALLASTFSIDKIKTTHVGHRTSTIKPPIKDAGMVLSEAFFWGPDERRVAYCKQMDVQGAVGGILSNLTPGIKPWEAEAIKATHEMWKKHGLKFNVVEGPPALGTDTKLGLKDRDQEISHFITFMKNLKNNSDVRVICYNWMPVINWYRTKKDDIGRAGALVTSFDQALVKDLPDTEYGKVSKEIVWSTLEYFLKAALPEAEKLGIKLAMHPDDPQVESIRGISRIMTSVENFKRMLNLVKSPSNGITMCQGNFSLMGADIPTTVKELAKYIHFVHFRNVRDLSGNKPSTKFEETFHDEGDIDMYAAMKAYYDIGFEGPIRPDHVPTMDGDSNERAGYSNVGALYAFGYMRGLMQAISNSSRKK